MRVAIIPLNEPVDATHSLGHSFLWQSANVQHQTSFEIQMPMEIHYDTLIHEFSPKTWLLHIFLLNISFNNFLIRSSRKSFRCIKVGLGDPQDDSQDDSEEDRLGRCVRAVTPFKTLDTLLDSSNKKSSSCSFLILVCRGATQSKLGTTFYRLAVWKGQWKGWAYMSLWHILYLHIQSKSFLMFPLKQVSLWPKEYREPYIIILGWILFCNLFLCHTWKMNQWRRLEVMACDASQGRSEWRSWIIPSLFFF